VRDLELAEWYRTRKCLICGDSSRVSGHHILSYKSHPEYDKRFNILPLCFIHHREIHDIGLTAFNDKYLIDHILIDRGFEFCSIRNKWFFPIEKEQIEDI